MLALDKYRKTALRKGVVVYQFRDWNHKGTVQVRKMVVGSWGAKQGYVHTIGNENARERIYSGDCGGNCGYRNFIAASDLTESELNCVAREIAQAVYEKHLASCSNTPRLDAIRENGAKVIFEGVLVMEKIISRIGQYGVWGIDTRLPALTAEFGNDQVEKVISQLESSNLIAMTAGGYFYLKECPAAVIAVIEKHFL